MPQTQHRPTAIVQELLAAHQLELMDALGARALDLLTPKEVAQELNIETKRLPDLIRQGWLAPAPGKNVGSAYLYYRWRVAFVKHYRRRYQKRNMHTGS